MPAKVNLCERTSLWGNSVITIGKTQKVLLWFNEFYYWYMRQGFPFLVNFMFLYVPQTFHIWLYTSRWNFSWHETLVVAWGGLVFLVLWLGNWFFNGTVAERTIFLSWYSIDWVAIICIIWYMWLLYKYVVGQPSENFSEGINLG